MIKRYDFGAPSGVPVNKLGKTNLREPRCIKKSAQTRSFASGLHS